MVVLRLKKMGRIHRPFYRLSAMDKRSPRDGAVIEALGWFDPLGPDGKQWNLNADRIVHWLAAGAQPSETVVDLLKRANITPTVGKGKRPISKQYEVTRARGHTKLKPPAAPAKK